MAMRGLLEGKEERLVKDLKETTLSYEKLGKQYGVSRQAIQAFSKKQDIKRPPKGHRINGCPLCQKLLQISEKLHSEFLSIHTIVRETGESRAGCHYHLRRLREKGLVDKKFGRLLSARTEAAYAIYFTEPLPIRTIGQRVGMKNFHSVIKKNRALGWTVPPSLYAKRVRGTINRANLTADVKSSLD